MSPPDQLSKCCGCIPLKIGTLIIGILDLVWSFLSVIGLLYTALWDSAQFAQETQVTPLEFAAILVSFLILRIVQASFAALLIVGVIESKAKYMVPWMILNLLVLVFFLVFGIVIACKISLEPEKASKIIGGIFVIFVYLINVVHMHYWSVKNPTPTEPDSSPLVEADTV